MTNFITNFDLLLFENDLRIKSVGLILQYAMVLSPQLIVNEAETVHLKDIKLKMASKQSVADTRAELAELVKRKAEVAVSIVVYILLYTI